MRILWHSNAPWCNTGYGRQTSLQVPLLHNLGHEVAISAFHGLQGSPTTWSKFPVYPGGDDPWGMDVVAGHYRHWKADLLITLQDCWAADPAGVAGLNVAHWMPVDCDPLGAGDRWHLQQTGGRPVAFSRHGEQLLADAGFDPLYVPHSIDTACFRPSPDREPMRDQLGLADRFVVGINAANNDKSRKGFPEQLQAFARLAARHDDAVLVIHARRDNDACGGLDLRPLLRACGLEEGEQVRFAGQYGLQAGLYSDTDMAAWYSCLDVLSACSWAEGCGLPLLEAQACGVPVVTTRASAMTEHCGPGWLVYGERFWNYRHEAWWIKPSVATIARCYEQAYEGAGRLRGRARQFASAFDVAAVVRDYWAPALAELGTSIPRS